MGNLERAYKATGKTYNPSQNKKTGGTSNLMRAKQTVAANKATVQAQPTPAPEPNLFQKIGAGVSGVINKITGASEPIPQFSEPLLRAIQNTPVQQPNRPSQGLGIGLDLTTPVAVASPQIRPGAMRPDTGRPKDIWDKVREVHENPTELMPFVSSADDIGELYKLNQAATRLKNGKQTVADEMLLKDYFEQSQRDRTLGYKVMDLVVQSVPFALELYLSAGTFNAAKISSTQGLKYLMTKAGKEVLEKDMEKLGVKIAVNVAGRSVQAPVAGATRMVASTLEKQFQSNMTDEKGKEESLLASAGKAFGEQWVETLSEFSGELFSAKVAKAILPKAVTNKIVESTLYKLVSKLNPHLMPAQLQAFFHEVGYNGVINEMLEERVADVAHGLLEKAGLGDQKFQLPSADQLLVELIGFSIPALGGISIGKAVQMADNFAQTPKLPVTVADLAHEAEVATKPAGATEEEETPVAPTKKVVVAEETPATTKTTETDTTKPTQTAKEVAKEKLITTIQTQLEAGNEQFVTNLQEKTAHSQKLAASLSEAIVEARNRIEKSPKAAKAVKEQVEVPQHIQDQARQFTSAEDFASDLGTSVKKQLGSIAADMITARDAVDTASKEYKALVARLKKGGTMEPVPVRVLANGKIETTDGSHRVTAAREAGVKVPVIVTAGNIKGLKTIEQVYKAAAKAKPQPKPAKETKPVEKPAKPVVQAKTEAVRSPKTAEKKKAEPKVAEKPVKKAEKPRVAPTETKTVKAPKIQPRPIEAATETQPLRPRRSRRKVTPKEYRNDKPVLYQEARQLETDRVLSNAETQAIIRDYFSAKELPVEFVDNIGTLDGGEAWGRYADEMVQFVNNPKESTPHHEAVHAFLDLFTTPFQKDAYIYRKLADLRKELGSSEVNYGIREVQLQHPTAKGYISTAAAARIYAEESIAEEFVEYVKGRQQKSVLRRFFDKIIRFLRSFTDKTNVQNLYQDIVDKRRIAEEKMLKEQHAYFDAKIDRFATTTKSLERLKKEVARDEVNRQVLQSYLKREGVTAQDKELFEQTLSEIQGDKINVADFVARVQAKVMPVALIRSNTYADYGTAHLEHLENREKDVDFKRNNVFETHIWDTPFRHGQTGHFGADYGNKKLSYEIREVTEPDTNRKVYIVMESGVAVNQDNVNEVVASTANTREDAQRWIDEHSAELERKKSGLLGHSRTATSLTEKSITDSYTRKINERQAELDRMKEDYAGRKKMLDFVTENRDKIIEAINKKVAKMLEVTLERRQKLYPDKKITMPTGRNSLSTLIDSYEEYLSDEKDWGNGRGNYPRAKVYENWLRDIFKTIPGYEAIKDLPPESREYYGFVDNIVFYESSAIRKADAENETDWTINPTTFDRLLSIYNTSSMEESIQRYDASTTTLKEEFKTVLEKNKNNAPVRHLLEVQSDPFQARYRVESDYTRLKEEVKEKDKQLEEVRAEVRQLQERVENDAAPASSTLATLNSKEEYLQTLEKGQDANRKALATLEANRTSLEKQYFAVGSKYHERALKEEIRLAAHDLLDETHRTATFRVPTPLTMSLIEGYVSTYKWGIVGGSFLPKNTNQEEILDAQMKQEMPARPISPIGEGHEGQVAIALNEELQEKIKYTGDFVMNSDMGQLYEVVDFNDDHTVAYLEEASSDYHENFFDNLDADSDTPDVGDDITYMGSDYTVLESSDESLTIAPSDRVRTENLDDYISESVDSRMDDVYYELNHLGDISTVAKVKEVLEDKGDNFDYYETQMILEAMSNADEDATNLDPSDFDEDARNSMYESESEYISSESYWEDMGYEHVSFSDNGYGQTVTYVESDTNVETVDAPTSSYNVFPNATFDSEADFEAVQAQALENSGMTTEEYQKKLDAYNAEVQVIKDKYAKLKEEYKTNPPPAKVNKYGEYEFNPRVFTDEQGADTGNSYTTVYNYYDRQVLPYFRKLRKDARLVTDENLIQWWETTVTEADQAPVEAYQRKTSYETLLDMATQLVNNQHQVIVKDTKKASRRPVEAQGKRRQSKAYSRVVAQIEEAYRLDVSYDQMNIDKDAEAALAFAEQYPDRAMRIARGLELPPQNVTETAISIVMADKAREEGKLGLWSDLEASRSRRQTRRGQEIVAEQGRVGDHSPEQFLKIAMQQREHAVMEQRGWVYENTATNKKKTTIKEGIEQEVETAKKKVENRVKSKLESAQELLNRLACK